MNYAPHGTLRQRHPKGTKLSLAEVLLYIGQVASALQYAHERRVIHRDIKPENMLLGSHGEILLSDFGIALISASSTSQSTKAAAGTVAYRAPEQILGKPRLASDQYSLGIIVYEWLCGERPFKGSFPELCAQHLYASPPSMQAKNQMVSSEVEAVVMRSLAKEPQQRFPNMRDFMNALEQAGQLSISDLTSTFISPLREDANTAISSYNDPTLVTDPEENEITVKTPIAGVTVTQSHSDASTFVKLPSEASSQQSLHGFTTQNTPILSSDPISQAFFHANTLLTPIISRTSEQPSTSNKSINQIEISSIPTSNVETKTRQPTKRGWLLIMATILIALALITGSFVFALQPTHSSKNNIGASAQVPTTAPTSEGLSSNNRLGKTSPTASLSRDPQQASLPL